MIAENSLKKKKEKKGKRQKSKCFSFVEKTHSNWAKVGFSRKFPNGEIVIASRGNCRLLQGFSNNIYFCKGSWRNLFPQTTPSREAVTPLLICMVTRMFLETFGIGIGFGSLGRGVRSSSYALPQYIAFIPLQCGKCVFNFQWTKIWFPVLPCFHHIFPKHTPFPPSPPLIFSFNLLIFYKNKPFYKGKVRGNEGKHKHIAKVRISQNKNT